MVIRVCRLMRGFPSLKGIERVPALSTDEKEIEYVEYGLAPGIYSLMKEQAGLGARFSVIASKREDVPDYEAINDVKVHRVGRPYSVTALMKMRELDKVVGIDVVHAHATSAIAYALLKRFMERKPYVVHVHGTTAGVLNSFKALLSMAPQKGVRRRLWTWFSLRREMFMWKRADCLIAVSNSIANELNGFYRISPDKIRVVHNGVDVNFFKPMDEDLKKEARGKLGIQGDPVILYVGYLGPRKGLEYLLKAAPKVIKKFPEAVFALLGGAPKFAGKTNYQQVLGELAVRLGVSHNIIFAGEVMHRDTLNFYKAADAFLFPTLYEGQAKALLEAMACGLPVVTTNVGGNPDAVIHEQTGILSEPGNAEQLADSLIRVLSDPSLAKDIGLKARERVKKYFTWTIAARKIMTIYEELLG